MAAFLRISILLFGVFILKALNGQQVSFEYITAKNGLPQSTIRGIVKDKYGFMWFGTWNGLCRYDGYSFKVYRTVSGDTSSIASNRIHYLHKDEHGTIWVTVFNEIVCRYNYDTDNFTRFKLASLPAVFRDSVSRMRDMAVLEKSQDFLRKLIGPFHLSFTKEHIVFETPVGVYGGLNDNNVNCMYRDDADILWVGTVSGGINKADLNASRFNSITAYAPGQPDVIKAIRSMWVDKDGAWLGTEDDGLVYLDQQTYTIQYVSPQLKGENIKALLKDKSGNIWIGRRSGLDKYDPVTRTLTTYFDADRESEYSRFYAIAEDPLTGELWFSYYNGVLKYNPHVKTFEKQPFGFYTRSGGGCLFFDSKNNLWIGTEYAGLVQLKRHSQSNVWIDTVIYRSVASDARSPDERVYSVTEDSDGFIWVGAANGLSRINPKTRASKIYTIKNGLADQYITRVMAQRPGYIWLAHKNGISKFNIKNGQIQNYAVKKPGQDYEFMDGSGFFDQASGQMYYGTTQGFIHFDPNEIIDNPFLPKPTFTALQVLNKTVHVGDTISGQVILSTPLHMAKAITLTHQDKSFSIEFTALHFSNPARNQYAYMLEGQDKEWIYTNANRRIASYSNLPAGKYILKVKASNSDGVWNLKPAMLEIVVLPPWWETWWAYAIYILLFFTGVFIFFRIIKIRQQYHREIVTERLRAEKAQELDQLKSSFFTNVSHEFRTPLMLIIDPLRSLLEKDTATEKDRSHYNVMYRNAQRLLTLINQFLDFRKLESGKMQLKPLRQDFVTFLKSTASAFNFKAEEEKVQFLVSATPKKIIMGFDADLAGKVLYNLLSNAFKFTQTGGTIRVTVQADSDLPEKIMISISDTGAGISAENIDKVFEPFYQVENKDQRSGTGVGLALTKELVELHGGFIRVDSKPGIGSDFIVELRNMEVNDIAMPYQQSNVVNEYDEADQSLYLSNTEEQADKPVLLLIEDNEDIRNYISANLSECYAIKEATNGTDGFEMAASAMPDLIISDIMMPGVDGLELCKKLKTDQKTSHIPVILLTAHQSDHFESEGYGTGADAYIVKPFSMPLLKVRIRNLIEGRARLRQLFRQSPESYSNPVGLNTADNTFLTNAASLIEEHMADAEVNVEWLANQLFMSRTQLYRKIKAITNQSVHEFVTGVRLNRAAGLLLQGGYSVTEIAFMVGYADATSFGRMFQKQYGTTPKKYSQQDNDRLGGIIN